MIALSTQLTKLLDVDVVHMSSVQGGDAAVAYRVELADGRVVFAKTKPDAHPEFFPTEAAGLAWLREAAAVSVPEVIAVSGDPPILVIEWIETGHPVSDTETSLGRSLAALHATGASRFGREDRRTTGSRGLPNEPNDDWGSFYAENRLRPLSRLSADTGSLPDHASRGLESVADRIDELVGPFEPPARLHGDLWGGNRLVGKDGSSWLIDPATFGGHREFDLAMMRLFGGFSEDVFAAYAEVAPLGDGWFDRVALYQLAPLAVHAIKFGGGYVDATIRALATL